MLEVLRDLNHSMNLRRIFLNLSKILTIEIFELVAYFLLRLHHHPHFQILRVFSIFFYLTIFIWSYDNIFQIYRLFVRDLIS